MSSGDWLALVLVIIWGLCVLEIVRMSLGGCVPQGFLTRGVEAVAGFLAGAG